MNTSFQNIKDLRFVITLGTGKFGSSTANQIILQGHRAIVDIDRGGGQMFGNLRAQIYGVSLSDMNQITTLQWTPDQGIPNTVLVYAIDGNQEALVFAGNIINAWGNYQSMPNVFLMIQAQNAFAAQMTPAAPTSIKGQIDVATLVGQIVNNMGFHLENNGVTAQLTDVYLANTSLEQLKQLQKMIPFDMYPDGENLIAICPSNTPRRGLVPQISAQTGMKGYPTFDGVGVNFETLFNPSIVFGRSIHVQSAIPKATGTWIVVSLSHRLESQKPGGAWLSTVRGIKSGIAV